MTVSSLRVAKTETRELAERARVDGPRRGERAGTGGFDDWQMSNTSFFTAFVVIAAVLTVLALALR